MLSSEDEPKLGNTDDSAANGVRLELGAKCFDDEIGDVELAIAVEKSTTSEVTRELNAGPRELNKMDEAAALGATAELGAEPFEDEAIVVAPGEIVEGVAALDFEVGDDRTKDDATTEDLPLENATDEIALEATPDELSGEGDVGTIGRNDVSVRLIVRTGPVDELVDGRLMVQREVSSGSVSDTGVRVLTTTGLVFDENSPLVFERGESPVP